VCESTVRWSCGADAEDAPRWAAPGKTIVRVVTGSGAGAADDPAGAEVGRASGRVGADAEAVGARPEVAR
jgi:hypothetical protein